MILHGFLQAQQTFNGLSDSFKTSKALSLYELQSKRRNDTRARRSIRFVVSKQSFVVSDNGTAVVDRLAQLYTR